MFYILYLNFIISLIMLYLCNISLLFKICMTLVLFCLLLFLNISKTNLYLKLFICFIFLSFVFIFLNMCVFIFNFKFVFSYYCVFFFFFTQLSIFMYDFCINHSRRYVYVIFMNCFLCPFTSFLYLYYYLFPKIVILDEFYIRLSVHIFDFFSICIIFMFFLVIMLRVLSGGDISGSICNSYGFCTIMHPSILYGHVYNFIIKNTVRLSYVYVCVFNLSTTSIVLLKFVQLKTNMSVYYLLHEYGSIFFIFGDFTVYISELAFINIFVTFEFIVFISIIKFLLVFMQKLDFSAYKYVCILIDFIFLRHIFYHVDKLYNSVYIDVVVFFLRVVLVYTVKDILPYIAFIVMLCIMSMKLFYNISQLSEDYYKDKVVYIIFISVTIIVVTIFIAVLLL